MKKDTSWNEVADWYDSLVNEKGSYQQDLVLPNLMRLAGDVKGKQVLDIASGQGFFSHAFAHGGAKVTGIELSPELVKLAQKGASKYENFIIGKAEEFPSGVSNSTFDLGLCVLALQNIKDADATIAEAYRVLKPGGRFFIVLNHPCFRIPKRSEWGFDEENKVQYRRLDSYISESNASISMHPGKEIASETISFHRPLQFYFKSFAKHGFVVEKLEEWNSNKVSEAGPRKMSEDKARKEFPLFLFLGLRK